MFLSSQLSGIFPLHILSTCELVSRKPVHWEVSAANAAANGDSRSPVLVGVDLHLYSRCVWLVISTIAVIKKHVSHPEPDQQLGMPPLMGYWSKSKTLQDSGCSYRPEAGGNSYQTNWHHCSQTQNSFSNRSLCFSPALQFSLAVVQVGKYDGATASNSNTATRLQRSCVRVVVYQKIVTAHSFYISVCE